MKENIKEMWVTALRSEEYEQGRNYLHQSREGKSQYCCLGVLTDLAKKNGVALSVMEPFPEATDRTVIYDDGASTYAAFTPKAVVDWAGLDSDDPEVMVDGVSTSLAVLNDTGSTFAEIADLIEREL